MNLDSDVIAKNHESIARKEKALLVVDEYSLLLKKNVDGHLDFSLF